MNKYFKLVIIVIAIPIVVIILLNVWSYIYYYIIPKNQNPKGLIIVHKGDRFQVIDDIKTSAMSHWKAPYTGSFDCVIPKGTILTAPYDGLPDARGFYCIPENYKEFEDIHVPLEIKNHIKYSGYSFAFLYKDINTNIKRLNNIK